MNKIYSVLLDILDEFPVLAAFLPAVWVAAEKPNSSPSLRVENNAFFRGRSRREMAQ
jgi:hypothetical protein